MLEHHQGDDVARRSEVAGGVELTGHARQPRRRPGARQRLDQFPIAAVLFGHGRPGDEPAAPSIGNRRPMIHWSSIREPINALARQCGPHGRAGDAERVPREMARHAVFLPAELRPLRGLLRNGIEDGALPRVLGGDLQQVGAADPADGDRVVEVDRARVLPVDLARLETGLRINQDLRRDRHVQRLEHRGQIARLGIEAQRRRTAGEPRVQRRHRRLGLRAAIGDGGMIPRPDERIHPLGDERRPEGGYERGAGEESAAAEHSGTITR